MPESTRERTFTVRHLQLARALFAVIAAVMITFSPDHSASVGLAAFSGFVTATALVFFLSAWLVFGRGQRVLPIVLGLLALAAGAAASVPAWRTPAGFFSVVIAWALVSGLVEGIAGLRAMRGTERGSAARSEARDALSVGVIGIVLALGLVLPTGFAPLEYYIEDAGRSFTLTGITIGVGLFGAYAAIVGVYLAIAGFSPRRETLAPGKDAA